MRVTQGIVLGLVAFTFFAEAQSSDSTRRSGWCLRSPEPSARVSPIPPLATDGLPSTERTTLFFDIVRDLDLERAKLEDGPGGLSVDLAYSTQWRGRKVIGNFLSTNRRDRKGDNVTGNPEGHIVSFNLARLLGSSDIYSTGTWYSISGPVVRSLHEIAESVFAWRGDRRTNKLRVESNTAPVHGVYPKVEGSLSVYLEKKHTLKALNGLRLDNIYGQPNGVANEANLLIQVLMGKQPKPRPGATYLVQADDLGVVSIKAERAARDLSTLFLIDAILEQGDRFSGGNIDLVKTSDGQYRIASLDNGAAALPGHFTKYPNMYLQWVRRVDRSVAEEIIRLDEFLQCGGQYLEFTRRESLLQALGLRTFQGPFIQNVHRVAEHVRGLLRSNEAVLN